MKNPKQWLVGGVIVLGFVVLLSVAVVVRMAAQNDGFRGASRDGFAGTVESTDSFKQSLSQAPVSDRAIAPEPAPGGSADFDEVTRPDRLVIQNASLSVVADDVRKAADELAVYATGIGGFVTQKNISDEEPHYIPLTEDTRSSRPAYATVVLRVPAERFQDALTKVRQIGKRVVSEQVGGQDVTEEFVDLQARVRNLEASEAQFVAIMNRAQRIEDVLQVQQQLERVRQEIEQLKGQIQYYERSARLATIQVSISTAEEDLPIVNPKDKWQPRIIFRQAVRALLDIIQGFLSILIWVAVFAPIWVPLILLLHWVKRRKR